MFGCEGEREREKECAREKIKDRKPEENFPFELLLRTSAADVDDDDDDDAFVTDISST